VVSRSHSVSLTTTLGRRNRAFWRMLAITVALLAAALAIAPVRDLFRFSWPGADSLAVALGTGVAVLMALEAMKVFGLRNWRRQIA
jgi:hypothetical protein